MKTIMKRIGIFILVLIITAGGLFFIFRAPLIKKFAPEVEQIGLIDIKIKNDTTYVSSKLVVKNKTFLKFEIDTIKYKLSLFGKTYLQSQKFIGAVLPGYGSDTVEFSLKIPYKVLLSDMKVERQKDDSANYVIDISLQYTTVFGKAEMPINKMAKIKIPQAPELEVLEINYKKFHRKTIQANVKIKIINHNNVTLAITDMHYSMKIIEQGNLKGKYIEPITINPNETTLINLPIEINPDNLGKTVFQVIFNKDNYDYILTLNAILESSDPIKESFHLAITKNGKMELRK